MTRSSNSMARRVLIGAAVFSTCVFQLGFLPSCEGILTTVNPCGTIFGFCDPEDVDLIFSDIPNYELDPTCTIPGYGMRDEDDIAAGDCASHYVYPYTPGNR